MILIFPNVLSVTAAAQWRPLLLVKLHVMLMSEDELKCDHGVSVNPSVTSTFHPDCITLIQFNIKTTLCVLHYTL